MEKFIRQQNVERFCHLLRTTADEDRKRAIEQLLAEERQKQREADDMALAGWLAS